MQEQTSIMKQVLYLVLALAATASAAWKADLRARFNYGLDFGKNYFRSYPQTVAAAEKKGYTKYDRSDAVAMPTLEMYCPSPPIFCMLYDDTGYIAGVRISLPQSGLTSPLDMTVQGFSVSAVAGVSYYWSEVFFVDKAFMEIDSAERIATRDTTRLIQTDVWVTGIHKELVRIPNTNTNMADTMFTKQACLPWMGLHYYYNMTTETECKSENILSFFPLYDNGLLVGIGFMAICSIPEVDEILQYFEQPSSSAIKLIVNQGPSCLWEYGNTPGVITMHIYFVDKPWHILGTNCN